MDETSQTIANLQASGTASRTPNNLQIDPKLLEKALKKMKGLIQGNGLDESKVTLVDTIGTTSIKMARFKARTVLKLVPQYGVKIEPGRNTAAELMPSESEFKKAISQIAIDARTNPVKRKQIIDFIFQRSDKGFGIKDQRTKFHALSRDFVQHERCSSCANTGRQVCIKCHGKAIMTCPKCQGRRHVLCPRCHGSTRIETNKGTISCQFCRADGRINCTKCGARGQVKCSGCGATGSTPCRVCGASGWMSHLAHTEIYAQINFDFDKQGLPQTLAEAISKNPARCVEKHDIEVAIANDRPSDNSLHNMGKSQNDLVNVGEPDDTIWIDYDAMCPYGPISFKMDEKLVEGHLFGFQARLLGFPYFLDDLTREGQQALLDSTREKKKIRPYLLKAAKYKFVADVIAQTLWIKNNAKAKAFLKEKYATGVNPDNIHQLVDATDLTIRNITRLWRTLGLTGGFILFSLLLEIYFISGGREEIKSLGAPEFAVIPLDILLVPLGIFMGIYGSKISAKWSQARALHGIVPAEILKRTLPKAGKTKQWSIIITVTLLVGFLALAIFESLALPSWLTFLMSLIPATGL